MGSDITLSALLRQRLAPDHQWLEDRVGPRDVTLSCAGYVRMLLMFRALHVTDDRLRRNFRADCQRYGIGDRERRLYSQIDLDLEALGHSDRSAGTTALSPNFFDNFALSLGAFYVVEGSALGNAQRLIARGRHLGSLNLAWTDLVFSNPPRVRP